MYPLIRLVKSYLGASRQSEIGWNETHVSHHICWPWDIDPWGELNNGRTLTLYDLGRVGFTLRVNVSSFMKENKWGFAIAGNTTRYRRRVLAFDRIEMHTKITCWDDRFFYFEQSMWKSGGECANHMLARVAITSAEGIVAPSKFIEAYGQPVENPPVPDWIATWIAAEKQRPWPPITEEEKTKVAAE